MGQFAGLEEDQLVDQKVKGPFAVHTTYDGLSRPERRVLVVRLDGPPKFPQGNCYVPVEEWETGRRFYAYMGSIELLNEMEVLGWVTL